ncbi:ATP-binding protein [Candidatus Saccharibacteria bacterium]|nr:ATP-binding protein [Candidatus Saccharibacteria bacterium]
MRRKIIKKLKEWKKDSLGRTAALIIGMRRVGKSYAVEEFAKTNYKSYILIDFSKVGKAVRDLFDDPLQDIDSFFVMLQGYFDVELHPKESVIIFDEVQSFPRARELVKHFVADGRYDYIETGSLMSIKENTKDIVIPSEEHEISMTPLDFEEFLWAINEEKSYEAIKYAYEHKKPLGQAMHRKMMTLFRQYIIVGGMPQAVVEYAETRNLKKVDSIKRDILKLYRDDIYKHGGKNALRIEQIYNEIPAQLSNANKRFMFSALSSTARFRDFEEALLWLSEAKIVNLCFNTTEPTAGLSARKDIAAFKCYQADTGLLISQTFDERALSRDEIYKKLLFNKLEFNNGMIMENVVAQMLASAGHKLFYYAETEDRMEIDFLTVKSQITSRHNILPIEVKSGKKYLANSLNKFTSKFSQQVGMAYILHDGDLEVDSDAKITYLPVYMAELL